jgi:hypothetical protein
MIIVVQFSPSHITVANRHFENIASFIKNNPSKCCLLIVFRKFIVCSCLQSSVTRLLLVCARLLLGCSFRIDQLKSPCYKDSCFVQVIFDSISQVSILYLENRAWFPLVEKIRLGRLGV